ncbi:hypothetical protein GCM10010377_42350 [Streptomyces viridiviolaceus]|nr:hypothetical protein GCM10010377_42350 [Streptomyces viridiviolaceus]
MSKTRLPLGLLDRPAEQGLGRTDDRRRCRLRPQRLPVPQVAHTDHEDAGYEGQGAESGAIHCMGRPVTATMTTVARYARVRTTNSAPGAGGLRERAAASQPV